MHDSFDVTTIVFAVLAIFVLFKLRSVLGTRTGNEQPPTDPFTRTRLDTAKPADPVVPEGSNVIRMPGVGADPAPAPVTTAPDRWASVAETGAWDGLDAIAGADPAFNGKAFADGARVA